MSTSATRIRAGAAALAVAGVLFLAYPALRPWHNESTVAGATASMSSTAWVAAHFFAMLGFILMPLGLLALRAAIATTRAEPLALTAAVLAWIGSGLTLPYYGAEDFGLHAIAGPDGPKTGLLNLIHAVRYQPLAMTIFGAGLLLIAAAAIMAAIACGARTSCPKPAPFCSPPDLSYSFRSSSAQPQSDRARHTTCRRLDNPRRSTWTSTGRSRAATTAPPARPLPLAK